jgi:glycosyltransferase involved in cell wall biosynthesis
VRKRRVIVSVSNDLVTDQRVKKQCEELENAGYEVLLLGRVMPSSLSLERPYKVHRANLPFNNGPLFYASLNVFLFFKILFSRCDLLWANDLDTLPATWLVSVLRGKKLVYDSHEYFTEVPEIAHKPLVKGIWKFFERLCIGRASIIITVSPSIARLLQTNYSLTEVITVRNVPKAAGKMQRREKKALGLDETTFTLLLQGNGINMNRGGEELIEAMKHIENAQLLVIGNGDAIPELKRMTNELGLGEKITFLPRMPYREMMQYTAAADIGFSLDKSDNINYQYSLPNKIFDYAMAGLPMVVSSVPEVASFVEKNGIGEVIEVRSEAIAKAVNALLKDTDRLQMYKENALGLAPNLSWESEFRPVLEKLKKLHG